MRKPVIIGNWKMNNGPDAANSFYEKLEKLIGKTEIDAVDWSIAAPFLSMVTLMQKGEDRLYIPLSAQNVNENESGAFTGEISVSMLQECGIEYTIIGHSERRQYFSETNEIVNKKLKALVNTFVSEEDYIIPVLAFGETEAEFDNNQTLEVVKTQLTEGLKDIKATDAQNIILAYEPIWAIGTGKTATPEQAQNVIKSAREIIKDIYDAETADTIRIQYGGSVNPNNVKELMAQPDIDGALVGGASLDPESFYKLITFNK